MRKRIRTLLTILLVFPLFFGPFNTGYALEETDLTLDGARIGDDLQRALKTLTGSIEVIVTFKGDAAPTTENLNLLSNLGITKGVSLNSLPMAGVLATKSQIEQLAQNDQVLSIYSNKQLEYFNADATTITGVDKVRTDRDMQAVNGGFPYTGKNVGVVVNDSGVDGTHNDHKFGRNLVQNVLGSTNLNAVSSLFPITYLENIPSTDTNSGHGTHVAGTVGGTGAMSGGKYEGAAPGADLIGYGSGAALFVLDGIGGFDYAITHQNEYKIRVITNSWGSTGDFDPYDPINIASKKAFDRGITVLFAAGNEGPGENTHNPYAKAPWVISVAAGEKDGTLADFSSRGTKGVGGTFEMDGQTWTWEDSPTVTAPGVDIVSTRAVSLLPPLGAQTDLELIEPGYLPYYTTMSGTSMATPHVAGIVALMLEADPTLSPDEVKSILQATATNMPGYERWEVGAGYVNAYAALEQIVFGKDYGSTLNINQAFNSSVETNKTVSDFTVDYSPLTLISANKHQFEVAAGTNGIVARIDAAGLLGTTGNPLNLVLIGPDGTEYSSGVSLLFPLYFDRTVSVPSPAPGTWTAEVRGLKGAEQNPLPIGLPETVSGTLTFLQTGETRGLKDIAGNVAEDAIKLAVSERLVDGFADGKFHPDAFLTRGDLAKYLVMGAEIRQHLADAPKYNDVQADLRPYVEAVTGKGAAFKDFKQTAAGVMLEKATGKFAPKDSVTRADLAYSLVQSLGLEEKAKAHKGDVTVLYKDQRIVISDQSTIPSNLKGYVQVALDLNILNAQFGVTQRAFDLFPTVTAKFNPLQKVTRGEYAVAISRFYHAFN